MNWSRSDTKTSFETLMGDANNAEIKWFYAQDDELTMGILEALQGGGIADSTKQAFFENKPFITGCGGLEELYAVLRGEIYRYFITVRRYHVSNIFTFNDSDSYPGYG